MLSHYDNSLPPCIWTKARHGLSYGNRIKIPCLFISAKSLLLKYSLKEVNSNSDRDIIARDLLTMNPVPIGWFPLITLNT